MSKYFFDTEFVENGSQFPIEFISIGIVAEDGRTYYAINLKMWAYRKTKKGFQQKYNLGEDDWVWNNVMMSLEDDSSLYKQPEQIAQEILGFVGEDKDPKFWAYYSAYDHVVLCQLFGKMVDLPEHFPMYTRDLKQLCDELGNPDLPEQGEGEHNALEDAHWNVEAYNFLQEVLKSKAEKLLGGN